MDNSFSLFPTRSSRTGFHYFQDTLHYREVDLVTWLPNLMALGASWLVVKSPLERTIPESFLQGLLQAEIEPIIQFDVSWANPPPVDELRILLEAYSRWGVHGVIFGERPNQRCQWGTSGWVQKDLVERFLDRYLPLANLAVESGLIPLFPPLEPGGNFWDLAFLRLALESLQKRHQHTLLEKFAVCAYAWTGGHPLNWGSGGPERWSEARPYFTPEGQEDHRGFRIFEWYQAIIQAVLHQPSPMVLLQAGLAGTPIRNTSAKQTEPDQIEYAITRLMFGEVVHCPSNPEIPLESVSGHVLTSAFWLLAEEPDSPYYNQAWFKNGKASSTAEVIQAWKVQPKQSPRLKVYEPKSIHSSHLIRHYVLLPTTNNSVSDWHLNLVRPLLKNTLPTVGFSLEEALLASKVTVIGDEVSFPEEMLDELRFSGCMVERISSNGTNIAS
jgi:hypothetical protein